MPVPILQFGLSFGERIVEIAVAPVIVGGNNDVIPTVFFQDRIRIYDNSVCSRLMAIEGLLRQVSNFPSSVRIRYDSHWGTSHHIKETEKRGSVSDRIERQRPIQCHGTLVVRIKPAGI